MAMVKDEGSPHQPLLSTNTTHKKTPPRFFISSARWILKITTWVIFIAWIALFFLVPSAFGTNLYDNWVTATSGTLFGETGSAFVLYSAPILTIAILAIPYLILSGKEEVQLEKKKKMKTPRFRLGTFPVLVDGVFGVVSAAELIGIILFLVFVVWAVYAYAAVNFNMLPSYGSLTPLEKRLLMLRMSAYCFGLITLSCLAFLFLPIARGSILLRLIDIPFEQATRYHIWLGNLTMFLLTLHGLCYIILWTIRGTLLKEIVERLPFGMCQCTIIACLPSTIISEAFCAFHVRRFWHFLQAINNLLVEWKSEGGANFAGVICYCFGLLMWVTTLPPVRKKYFELFFYTHQLYIVFVIFFALHTGDTYFSKAAGGIFLFMLDRFLRFCQSRRTVSIISATSFPCGTVKLVVPKPGSLHYNALGFIFLRIRELSWLQWHPFSVSSSPMDGKYHLSVLVKVVGDWTTKLRGKITNISAEEFRIGLSIQPHSEITASVEGPYGHESPYHLMYENLILVAKGSGISPFLAILSDILHRVKERKPCLSRNILLVWAMKKSNELSLLSTVDMESICPFSSDKLNIEIQAYITRESDPPLEEEGKGNRATISCVFPVSNECGMSVLVGTGNKIWPGIYVISSTIGFVVTLGLLNMCYINPFSISYWWYRGFLFLACMVASVFIFGGLVIALWHFWERTSAREECEEDREKVDILQHNDQLAGEDIFQEKLASSSTIVNGQRPNFKEIFGWVSERWGHVDVGVIVCGPPTLQSTVAKECRSQNLRRGCNHPIFHFNSHSFDL